MFVVAHDIGLPLLTVPVGHFLTVLTHVLGDFTEVSAYGAIQVPTASFVDREGKHTGETINKSTHDQVSLSGILNARDGLPGPFVNVHCRAALPLVGEKGAGRTLLKWIIDGEDGTIEVVDKPGDAPGGAFIMYGDKVVLLNGQEVPIESSVVDRLGSAGKAWLEFAKGVDGLYWGIDESVKLHRVLDALLASINEGRKVSLL